MYMEEKILNVLISIQSDVLDIKADVKQLNQRMDRLEERMDRLEERMDRLEEKVDGIDKKHDNNYIELRNQRQIDSNNIAKILSIQTKLLKNEDRMYA